MKTRAHTTFFPCHYSHPLPHFLTPIANPKTTPPPMPPPSYFSPSLVPSNIMN